MQIAHSYQICHNFRIVQSCSRKYYHSFANLCVSKIACVKNKLFFLMMICRMAPGFFSTPQPCGCGCISFCFDTATPTGLEDAKKDGGHPTYQHQPICSFLCLYRWYNFSFGFGIGLGRCYGFRFGLLRYVFVIMSLTFKHINSILYCLRCLLSFSLELLTLSIRFFCLYILFLGGPPRYSP